MPRPQLKLRGHVLFCRAAGGKRSVSRRLSLTPPPFFSRRRGSGYFSNPVEVSSLVEGLRSLKAFRISGILAAHRFSLQRFDPLAPDETQARPGDWSQQIVRDVDGLDSRFLFLSVFAKRLQTVLNLLGMALLAVASICFCKYYRILPSGVRLFVFESFKPDIEPMRQTGGPGLTPADRPDTPLTTSKAAI